MMTMPDPQVRQHLEAMRAPIEALDGRLLPGPHVGRDLGPLPPDLESRQRDFTTGCGNPARFELPYTGEEGEARAVTACVMDDFAALWPVLGA